MTLREIFTELDFPPTEGDYKGFRGLTWFQTFEPKATVYKSLAEPCCWKIFLPGRADLYSWWVKDAPGAKEHELLGHVPIHRDTYKNFNTSASRHVDKCFSKAKAECWKSVINGPLKDAWLAHNHTANLQLDAWYRGSEIPLAITEENYLWYFLAYEEAHCESIE